MSEVAGASEVVRPGALSGLLRELAADDACGGRELAPGAVVGGRFELLRELGRGGFGVVFEARDRELHRTVAVKTLRGGGQGTVREERLLREAELAARLSHPNLVTLHDVGRSSEGPYLVLELLTGETLAARLRHGRLSVREAVRVALAVARGLAHAHALGVVHRDLTPGNVFLCADGAVKVLDLGMAHAFGARRTDGGTADYMAPEQERGAPEDERTDVFALGAILYRALSGEPPPRVGAAPVEPARAGAPGGLRLDLPELPALADLVRAMTAPDPVARPRDAAAVVEALSTLERELSRAEPGSSPVRAVHAVRATAPEPPAVAVLPFADLSPARDQAWLCEGLAEEVLHALSSVRELRVVSRSASARFGQASLDPRAVAQELGVTALLEGSVRRSGQRVRITARLVGADGFEAWSERFDRVLEDVFAVEEEIASAVASSLKLRLTLADARRLRRIGTRDAAAAELYLRARALQARSCRRHAEARTLLLEAVERDPRFADAHAALAQADVSLVLWQVAPGDPEAHRAEALAACEAALRIEPGLADAHVARADLLALAGHRDEAETAFRTALELNPEYARAYYHLGAFHVASGRMREAAEAFEACIRRDPDEWGAVRVLPQVYRSLGDRDAERAATLRALAASDAWVAAWPDDAAVILSVGALRAALGAREAGLALVDRALRMKPDDFTVQYNGACAYAKVGDRERALAVLDGAVGAGRGYRAWIEHDSDLDAIRDDPRFAAILARMPR